MFVTQKGTVINEHTARGAFHQLVQHAGPPARAGARPRLHEYADLRVMPTSARSLSCSPVNSATPRPRTSSQLLSRPPCRSWITDVSGV